MSRGSWSCLRDRFPSTSARCGGWPHSSNPQLPASQGVLTEVELVIEPGTPPTVRVPDVLVGSASGIEANLPLWKPADVSLVVEILSDGTKRTDRVTKFAEYAEVGIEHYWLIDLDEPVSLTAFQLVDEHYESAGEHAGRAALTLSDSRVVLDLPSLTSARPDPGGDA
ncbi:Uma2 family endonuclease [Nocardia sp. IFM 10818]